MTDILFVSLLSILTYVCSFNLDEASYYYKNRIVTVCQKWNKARIFSPMD